MDTQVGVAVIGGLLALLSAIFGWFARMVWAAVQALTRDLTRLEVRLGSEYVRQDRLRETITDAMEPIKSTLARIEETLSHKVDKP